MSNNKHINRAVWKKVIGRITGCGCAEEDEAESLAQCFQMAEFQILNFIRGQRRLEHPEVVLDGVTIDYLLENILLGIPEN